jgi:hypothetical protein
MKTKAAIMMIFLLAASPVFSSDMTGSLGVGYDTSTNCISLRYFFGNFGIGFLAGFYIEPMDAALGDTQTLLDLRGALSAMYALELFDQANLNVFACVQAEYGGSHIKGQGNINFYLRAGLSPEIFILENLSVEASFGLEVAYVSTPIPNVYRLSIELYGNQVSIVSGLSFHWYFWKPKKEKN